MISFVASWSSSLRFPKLFYRSSNRSRFEMTEEPYEGMVPVRAEVARVIEGDQSGEEDVVLRHHAGNLWCNLAATVESGIVARLSKEEIAVQEAIYEVIRTEESYLKRLVVLQEHFAQNLNLPPRSWKEIFEFVQPVLEVSHRFLEDLISERRRSQGPYLPVANFCRVVRRHAECDFDAYVRYCCNQIYQQRCLQQLKAEYPVVEMDIKQLEKSAKGKDTCRTLESYLLLPVQRITLLPLLIDAVTKNLTVGSDDYYACLRVGDRIKQIVSLCNERTREIQHREEMLIAGNQLDFDDVPGIGIVSCKRWLVKKGPVKRFHAPRISHYGTYHKSSRLRFSQRPVWIFLFSDLIIVARKRKNVEEERYKVLSYCQRNLTIIFDKSCKIPEYVPEEFDCKGFQLCLLQNHDNVVEEMILFCENEEDRNNWVELLASKSRLHAVYPKTYQEWDCPQMRVLIPFEAQQPTDLTLNVGDVVDIRLKKSDGWCFGVKSGSETVEGWFPRNHVVKVASVYERAKQLRRNYQRSRKRLLESKTDTESSYQRESTFYLGK